METLINWFGENFFFAIFSGAFMCGVALFYLVMRRTMKHREETSKLDS